MIKRTILIIAALMLLGMKSVAQEKRVKLPQPSHRAAYKDYSQLDRGFWYSVEAAGGSSLILEHANTQRVEASFTMGYRFNEFFKVGAGMGTACYVNGNKKVRGDKNALVMPLFVNVRGNVISHESREAVPYWSVNVGDMLGDGFFVSPTLGVRIGQSRHAFLMGIKYTLADMDVRPEYSSSISFFSLNIGYEF